MSTTTTELYCSGCGDEVVSVDEKTKKGPCCHNLPQRWSRNSEGLYVGPPGEDGDEGESYRPTCTYCGYTRFTVTGTQQIDASDYEDDEDYRTLYHDAWEADFVVTCGSCGRDPGLSLEGT